MAAISEKGSMWGGAFALLWFAYIGFPLALGGVLFNFSAITGLDFTDDRIWYAIPWSIVIALIVYAGIRISNRHKTLIGCVALSCLLSLTFLISHYSQFIILTLLTFLAVTVGGIFFVSQKYFVRNLRYKIHLPLRQ
jgi:peptidoglycan/LPS O-acetylase OafA/YrhL